MAKQSQYLSVLIFIRQSLNAFLLACIISYFAGRYMSSSLPADSELIENIDLAPIQDSTYEKPFRFDYMGHSYNVDPQASYDINGLIVSHNNIHAWWDFDHDKTSVDIKDLCLIWGPNAKVKIFSNMSFFNETTSCHYQQKKYIDGFEFDNTALSNNHLLSEDPLVRKTIQDMRIGDQVHLTGYLVNYSDTRYPDFTRRSSLTRMDTAGGACEVMLVTQAEILKKGPRLWHNLYDFGNNFLLFAIILKVVYFCLYAWLEFKLS